MSPVMRNGENPRDHLLSSWMKTQRSNDCSSVVRVRIKEAIQFKLLFCVDTIVVSTVILLFLLHEESDLQSHSKTVSFYYFSLSSVSPGKCLEEELLHYHMDVKAFRFASRLP
jgi:hypothetical protein